MSRLINRKKSSDVLLIRNYGGPFRDVILGGIGWHMMLLISSAIFMLHLDRKLLCFDLATEEIIWWAKRNFRVSVQLFMPKYRAKKIVTRVKAKAYFYEAHERLKFFINLVPDVIYPLVWHSAQSSAGDNLILIGGFSNALLSLPKTSSIEFCLRTKNTKFFESAYSRVSLSADFLLLGKVDNAERCSFFDRSSEISYDVATKRLGTDKSAFPSPATNAERQNANSEDK